MPADGPGFLDPHKHPYDALLVVSFGGPEGPEEVEPFLDNVLRGLGLPEAAKARIAKRYAAFGGVSPINAHTRAFIDALRHELDAHGPALPIYWGNRNWHPFLADTVRQMANDGVRRAIAYLTSMFSSYNGCRKYREDLFAAGAAVEGRPTIDRLRFAYNHPGFIDAVAQRTRAAFETLGAAPGAAVPILFTAHSLPQSLARNSSYEAELREACALVGGAIEHEHWRLVYQSHNAAYGKEPWLGPDIGEALGEVAAQGATRVVVVPIGFVCDHLEVVLDLDQQAAARARELGLEMIRAGTVGTHPSFVAMVRELIVERMIDGTPRRFVGIRGPSHDICPERCCLPSAAGPVKPALCGADTPPWPAPAV